MRQKETHQQRLERDLNTNSTKDVLGANTSYKSLSLINLLTLMSPTAVKFPLPPDNRPLLVFTANVLPRVKLSQPIRPNYIPGVV